MAIDGQKSEEGNPAAVVYLFWATGITAGWETGVKPWIPSPILAGNSFKSGGYFGKQPGNTDGRCARFILCQTRT